jgi:predicted peroxiredoxin
MNMRKVKLSHEVPFCLLEQNLKWSNYQYCLPHLMEEDETYRNFFLQCKENGVEIYLDNSLHELGESVGDELLIKWINI